MDSVRGGLSFLLILIGAILVILGRKAFGGAHSRNVILSIVLFFLAIIIVIAGAVLAAIAVFAGATPGQQPSAATIQAFITNLFIVAAIATIVGGLVHVFLTFALQDQRGKMLLVVGYLAGVAIAIATFAVINGAVQDVLAVACPGGTCNSSSSAAASSFAQTKVSWLGLLPVIPSLLYAGAYYLVWSRIKKGEIPGPSMPPGIMPQPAASLPPR